MSGFVTVSDPLGTAKGFASSTTEDFISGILPESYGGGFTLMSWIKIAVPVPEAMYLLSLRTAERSSCIALVALQGGQLVVSPQIAATEPPYPGHRDATTRDALFPANIWTHFALKFDPENGGLCTLFVDGVQAVWEYLFPYTEDLPPFDRIEFAVATDAGSLSFFDTALYNKVLSDEAIKFYFDDCTDNNGANSVPS
jgi:hypothetical protein